MYRCAAILMVSLGLCAWSAAQTPQPKPVSKKSATSTKPASPPAKPADATPKTTYSELTIGELVTEDANRWSDKMSSRISVSGFVTEDGRYLLVTINKGADNNNRLYYTDLGDPMHPSIGAPVKPRYPRRCTISIKKRSLKLDV